MSSVAIVSAVSFASTPWRRDRVVAPFTLGSTGTRSFSTNTQGTIFYDNTAVAPIEATFTTTATPIQ